VKAPYQQPRIPTPKERAESRARMVKALLWMAAALPLIFVVMAYGYSDQAPAGLREFTMKIDGAFGSPVWEILKRIAAP
jgi:hypothetical protein